jgi:hypothetical protein
MASSIERFGPSADERPLLIDLFAGLGGWSEPFIEVGWRCIGFDIERHVYGEHRYPGQLVLQDVTTLHGSQFKDATLIVASPPCQEYSYMAMPWKRAKAKAAAIRADTSGKMLADLNRLFDACFRIQAQASLAAGRRIPMVVENVRGAQPWVGRSRWAFGSFHLWGDVPALMPMTAKAVKVGMGSWRHPDDPRHIPGLGFNVHADRRLREDIKNSGGSWFAVAHNKTSGKGRNPDGRRTAPGKGARFTSMDCGEEGVKQRGSGREWFAGDGKISCMTSSKSPARKMASAMIAKIPAPLAQWIASCYYSSHEANPSRARKEISPLDDCTRTPAA